MKWIAVLVVLTSGLVLFGAGVVRLLVTDVILVNASDQARDDVYMHLGPLSRGPYQVAAGARVRVPVPMLPVERDLAVLSRGERGSARAECGLVPRLGPRYLVVLDDGAASCRMDT